MALLVVAAWGVSALAHPLGNDSITHFSVLYLSPERVEVTLFLDFAENPAVTICKREIDTNGDGDDSVEEQQAWLDRMAVEYQGELRLALDDRPLPLRLVGEARSAAAGEPVAATRSLPTRTVLKLIGVASMPTYRLQIRYSADLPALAEDTSYTLMYLDATYPRHPGLKRVLLERSDAVAVEFSDRQYLDDPPDPFLYELYDPANMPQERDARVVFRAAGAAAPTERPDLWPRLTDPRNDPARTDIYRQQAKRIEQLIAGGLSLPVLILVAVLCFGYGAAHALAPGHAKTIVAAYLISLRGTYRHAMLLALIVTLTHTALVIVVGLVFLKVSAPAGSRLQLWLGFSAGVIIAGMGGWLLVRAAGGRLRQHVHAVSHGDRHGEHAHPHHTHGEPSTPRSLRDWLRTLFTHSHPHLPIETHDHGPAHAHPHPHPHPHAHTHDHRPPPQLTYRLLLWLGISGGIVPCPAAVWIMLLGIAQGKPAAGLFAVIVFGMGLALTLMGIGFLALSSRRFAERWMGQEGSRRWLLTILPAVGGAAVLVLGALIAANYAFLMRTGQPLIAFFG